MEENNQIARTDRMRRQFNKSKRKMDLSVGGENNVFINAENALPSPVPLISIGTFRYTISSNAIAG